MTHILIKVMFVRHLYRVHLIVAPSMACIPKLRSRVMNALLDVQFRKLSPESTIGICGYLQLGVVDLLSL